MSTELDAESAPQDASLRLRIPPDPRYARTVRDAIVGFGSLHGFPEYDIESMLFAVGEALANAIEHASSDRDIEVAATIDAKRFLITIIDYGCGFDELPGGMTPLPHILAERGRGIPIMQRCTDYFRVDSLPGRGTAVTLGRYRRRRRTRRSQETSATL